MHRVYDVYVYIFLLFGTDFQTTLRSSHNVSFVFKAELFERMARGALQNAETHYQTKQQPFLAFVYLGGAGSMER